MTGGFRQTRPLIPKPVDEPITHIKPVFTLEPKTKPQIEMMNIKGQGKGDKPIDPAARLRKLAKKSKIVNIIGSGSYKPKIEQNDMLSDVLHKFSLDDLKQIKTILK